MNPPNKCAHLTPKKIVELPENDSLKLIYNRQKEFQEYLGKYQEFGNASLYEKTKFIKENIICIITEITELLDMLPWKYWKKYSENEKNGWPSKEHRDETLFEYIDILHFFLNIAITLGFTPEEIYSYYFAKNDENFDRQKRGY